MALNESPVGVYADVTGVVDTTAAAEVAALFVILKAYIVDPDSPPAAGSSADTPPSPDFSMIPPNVARLLRAELDACAAAVAAAPTV